MNFVCTLACSQEFKRVNNITGTCAYCKNERIIKDAKRIDNEDCFFCRDTCVILLRHQLKKKWGKHCESCAYCFSVSKTVVTAEYEGTYKEFCSEDCSSNYKIFCTCNETCSAR
uniref:TRASH domain-containing protein n=1 Tax=Mastacembelus armatus TaxID=205130 RepID=A0A3Q3RWD7_9TELE